MPPDKEKNEEEYELKVRLVLEYFSESNRSNVFKSSQSAGSLTVRLCYWEILFIGLESPHILGVVFSLPRINNRIERQFCLQISRLCDLWAYNIQEAMHCIIASASYTGTDP